MSNSINPSSRISVQPHPVHGSGEANKQEEHFHRESIQRGQTDSKVEEVSRDHVHVQDPHGFTEDVSQQSSKRHVSHIEVPKTTPQGPSPSAQQTNNQHTKGASILPELNPTPSIDPAGHNKTVLGSIGPLPQPLGSLDRCFLPCLQMAGGAALMLGCAYKTYQEVMKFFQEPEGLCDTLARKKDQLENTLEERKNQLKHTLENRKNQFEHNLEDRKNQLKHTLEDRRNQLKHSLEDEGTWLKHSLEDRKNHLKHTLLDRRRLSSSESEPSVLRTVGYGCLTALGAAMMIKA